MMTCTYALYQKSFSSTGSLSRMLKTVFKTSTAGGFDIVLPAGSYRVRGFRRGCGLTALVKIEVGDNAPAETHYLGPVRCNRGMEPTVLSCDNIFQQDEQP